MKFFSTVSKTAMAMSIGAALLVVAVIPRRRSLKTKGPAVQGHVRRDQLKGPGHDDAVVDGCHEEGSGRGEGQAR